MALTDKQRGVIKGVITGAIITIVVLSAGIAFIPTLLTPDSTVGERLAFTLKADILVIVWLVRCIGMVGQHRFHTPEDIDGAGLTTGTPQAKVLQATLQNTLEQAVLAIVVHLIWAVVMPVSWISGFWQEQGYSSLAACCSSVVMKAVGLHVHWGSRSRSTRRSLCC